MTTCLRCEDPLADIEHTCEGEERAADRPGSDYPPSFNDTAEMIEGLNRKLDALTEQVGQLTECLQIVAGDVMRLLNKP